MDPGIPVAIIDKLSKIIVEPIVKKTCQEIALVCNFTRDFDWLKELTSIHDFLVKVNLRAVQDKGVKRWLNRVQDVAWEAEDIVEECALRPLYASNVTQSCVCIPVELYFRYKMAKRIQKVKERVIFITKGGEQLKLLGELVSALSEQSSSNAERKENSLLPSDSQPVGIELKVQKLITEIDGSTVPVIAVVGMGGAGKTFLLKNAFKKIRARYTHSIWLSISQAYSIKKLQLDLMKTLNVEVNNVTEDDAARLIHDALGGTKSLIVLDDVWRVDREKNIMTRLGLPVGPESQCKVVVTTRNRQICDNLGALPYDMELLSEQESWKLFCAHAFPDEPVPDQLQAIASQVEKECGRLPLALKITGASLSRCTELKKWEFKLNQLKKVDLVKFVDPNYDLIMHILELSYDSLPSPLKVCFSYLSFFPEDEKINAEYLINLWIAEGFISQEGEYQWEVAWRYLDLLASLCLLEVEEDEHLVKHCKVHDLLLDLAILISKEHQCKFSVNDAFTSAKRILLHQQEAIVQTRESCPRSLRTLSLYDTSIEKVEKKFVSPVRLLRVLDLSNTEISTLPSCVGKLKILKLLNLSCTKIKKIPKCVKSLKRLLFLDLSDCELERLPKWINKLKCLQHLNISGCNDDLLSHMPKGISKLVDLRVLRSSHLRFCAEKDGFLKLEDLPKLTCLQELSLEVNKEMNNGTFSQQPYMRYLSVKSSGAISSLPPNLSDMQYLQTLKLEKFAVPNWLCALTDLAYLKLEKCDCSYYPEFQNLPNLKKLVLDGDNTCTELPKVFGKPSGFPKLRFLTIMNFSNLEVLPDLEDGAMPFLQEFYVGSCPRVKKVPEGLEWLTKLKKFYYTGNENDELNRGQQFWDNIRANIKDQNNSQVEIIVTII
ncbi:hypothetical protein SUGI_0703660 [Cryptomeria japonica]|uniref:putative disease resistance protein RGA3 n=1 Tax=Cryptomeria japonica TaxID=3369 RepID=UPI002414950E|nr:putative disease resistance protein RGA3 [Cryptomeria japonica]GLJ34966.1 hypothetical protein SUGI_0703660 [Cryptomeria japonica]